MRASPLTVLPTVLFFGLCTACNGSEQQTDAGADSIVHEDAVPNGDRGVGQEASVDGPPADMAPDTVPKPPAKWDKAADMLEARSWHTATLLADGTVLVAGGIDSSTVHDTAERYDPKTNSWTSAGSMSQPHWHHVAERLSDGRVIVIGGCSSGQSNSCMIGVGADIYDPKNNSWTKAQPMLTSRRSHASTLLQDGRVLVVGGFDNLKDHTSIEIYDPKTDSWASPVAKLTMSRNRASATRLPTGKVLIVGGFVGLPTDAPTDTMALFDPGAGTLSVLKTKLKEARWRHTATLLDNGRVLITGGSCETAADTTCKAGDAEIYDPVTDQILPGGSPGTATIEHQATLLNNGQVLITGGSLTEKLARLFAPKQGMWSQTAQLNDARESHAACLLDDGRVIVTGGENGSSWTGTKSVEIYTP
jgi:N-acetylneuraminic acid mutarotase